MREEWDLPAFANQFCEPALQTDHPSVGYTLFLVLNEEKVDEIRTALIVMGPHPVEIKWTCQD